MPWVDETATPEPSTASTVGSATRRVEPFRLGGATRQADPDHHRGSQGRQHCGVEDQVTGLVEQS